MLHEARFKTARVPRHIVQRGIDRDPCFLGEDDYLVYRECLQEGAERFRCAIHAYGLTAHAVHLLASAETEERLSQMVRYVNGRYLEYMSYIHQRNGALWEARRDSTPVEGSREVLRCYYFIECCPVRAGLAVSPGDYPWSSYRHHAGGGEDPVIRDHPAYLGLGAGGRERQLAYRELFREPARAAGAIAWLGATGRRAAPRGASRWAAERLPAAA